MHIRHVEIANFRKLEAVRIDFSETTTVFVGANNSGKTSAMAALRLFLGDRGAFSLGDLTLSHWSTLDEIGRTWEEQPPEVAPAPFDWGEVAPFLDVWLSASLDELHSVLKILPTLDWDGSPIGVRLRYEPRDPAELRLRYVTAARAARDAMGGAAIVHATAAAPGSRRPFSVWPRSLTEFLSPEELASSFVVRAHLLDPAKLAEPEDGLARPQTLASADRAIDGQPFHGLVQVDEIDAQRGFGQREHASRGDRSPDQEPGPGRASKLSRQLAAYFSRHLDPRAAPIASDIAALRAIDDAEARFGAQLQSAFQGAFCELGTVGYPGFTDPRITIDVRVRPTQGLDHASAVQYEIPTANGALRLPEQSNGLGYQNLVWMLFRLMSFRDDRMKVGKAGRTATGETAPIPPLHLVLVEEPEAHLHPQVQQVFIERAYGVLRGHPDLDDPKRLRTQLVVSTHSSHVAHAADFAGLRYFRRLPARNAAGAVPVSSVVNLSTVFGPEEHTSRFVTRYLKATHCDLFFADGAVLVEGPAERILLPHLVRVRKDYEPLRSRYVTWLEIGGSHAHRLKRLLEALGLDTLIVTDIDAEDSAQRKVASPERGAGLLSRNQTLRTWIPGEASFDTLLDLGHDRLVRRRPDGRGVRVAYQQPTPVTLGTRPEEAIAYTFEDALVYANVDLFRDLEGPGLISRFRRAVKTSREVPALSKAIAGALASGSKAEFALDLVYHDRIDELRAPAYIHEGLLWLMGQLEPRQPETAPVAAGAAP